MKRNKIALSASLVALGIGAGGFAVASPGTANPTPRAGVPQFVARCLARPEAERGACFAAASLGRVPQFVARCLARPEAERGACFAAAPSANRGDQDRGGANPSAPGGRGGIPNFVAHCLAAPEAERGACFAAAAGAN